MSDHGDTSARKRSFDESQNGSSPQKKKMSLNMSMDDLLNKFDETLNQKLDEKLSTLATELCNAVTEIEDMKKDFIKLETELNESRKREFELRKQIDNVKIRERQNNIICKGLTADDGKSAITEFLKIISENMKLNKNILKIKSANEISNVNHQKVFLFEFEDKDTVSKIMLNLKKLSKQHISITRDLPKNVIHRRHIIRILCRDLRSKESITDDIKSLRDGVQIGDDKFLWNEINNSFIGTTEGQENGNKYIKDTFGVDVEEIINEKKNVKN